MKSLTFPTSVDAWIGVNRFLIEAKDPSILVYSNQAIVFDAFLSIKRSWVPDTWDFTKTVNYTPAKWSSLKSNYLDMTHMEEVMSLVRHRELKKDRNYNISMWFANNHDGGKGCLLNVTFSRRYGDDLPTMSATMRASEFYKRGMFDLLLLHRLGVEAWGEVPFGLNIFATQLWGGSDWLSLLTTVIPPDELFNNIKTPFHQEVKAWYDKFRAVKDIDGLKYHAHQRACKVLQGKVRDKAMYASDCQLY